MIIKLIKYYISLCYWNLQPARRVKAMQLRKFKEVFEYAREHSEFYRELYTQAGVMELEIKDWSDVEKVPVVDKDTYRTIPLDKRMTTPFDKAIHNIETTSGSSGNPLPIAYEKWVDYTGHLRVLYMLLHAAHYNPFSKILMIARYEEDDEFGVEKDLGIIGRLQKHLHLFRREIVSIYRDPDFIIDRIQSSKPTIVWTTPSVMEIVANRLIVREEKLHVPFLFFTSENVAPEQFRKFQQVVSPTIIDLFGAMESPSISYDVNKSGRSRVFANACLPEYIDRRIQGGQEVGTLVITSLLNKATPFVRYNLKDYGEILPTEDFPNKYLGPICGRMDDILHQPDGTPFFHHMAHEMYMDFDKCLHFSFLQINDGPIILKLIPNPKFSLAEIQEEAMLRWNKRCNGYPLEVQFVEEVEINPKTGKCKNIEHRRI